MQCPICKSVGLPYDMFRDMCSSCSRAQQRMEAQVDTVEQVFKERTATKDTNQMSALKEQTGGDHYKSLKIQPIEYIHANNIPFAEGSVIKYVTRWRGKNGVEDLKKARHFLDLLIELETRNAE